MKNLFVNFVGFLIFFMFFNCNSRNTNENTLIQYDVSASYPEKEIALEEIADIEYLQLNLDDEFLFTRDPHIVTSQKIIISHDGDVLIFSRNGEPLSKFNHKGIGPGEYPFIRELLYDETADEIFIKLPNTIMVYSSSGEYRRTIPLQGRMEDFYCQFVNYDSETLLLHHDYSVYSNPFTFISKKDGSVTDSIMTPKEKEVNLLALSRDGSFLIPPTYRIVKHRNGYLLTDYSIDTVYLFTQDRKLTLILERRPKIQTMDQVIFLNSFIEAGNYDFVCSVTVKNENGSLPKKYLMRNKKTGSIYRQKITFSDYQGKSVYLSPETIANTHDSKLGLIILDLGELSEANNENRLKGKLKELVDSSEEEGNNIFLLLHFK